MKTLTIAIVLTLLAVPLPASEAQKIATVHQKLVMAESGPMLVSLRIEGIEPPAARLRLTLNTADIVGTVETDAPGVTAEVVTADGSTYCELSSVDGGTLPDLTITWRTNQYDDWRVKGAGQFGAISLGYRYLNTAGVIISSFTGEVILPAGYIVQAIKKTVPAEREDSSRPPYRVAKNDGHHSLFIERPEMKIGDEASLAFTARREEQPILLFLIFAIIAILYLVFFKDVLRPGGVGE